MSEATVTEAGKYEHIVAFDVPEADLEDAKTRAARKLSQDLRIRGFRPGKAPRAIVEATVGADRLRAEAIDEMLPEKVGEVLSGLDVRPAVPPSVESLEDTDDGVHIEVRITTWPKLETMPEIHDRTIEVGNPAVTDEELGIQIDRFREQFASVETADRPAELGDYVSMDISATFEGEAVPEAEAAGLLYEVGSGGLIDAMDDALVGTSAGDTVNFSGPLPEGFGEKAGLEVEYTVVVNDVREQVLPEVTDEWVSENTEFDTPDELRSTLREQMTVMKQRSLANQFQDQALDQLVAEIDIELPEALVRNEMDEVFHRFSHRLEEQDISLEDYFRATGIAQEAFLGDLEAQAERSLKTRLLLEAVVDDEGLEVSDEELASVVEMVVASSEDPERVRQALQNDLQRKALVDDILRNKAVEAVVKGARPVDEDGNDVELFPDLGSQVVESELVESEVVESEVLEGEVFEGEVLEGEIVEAVEVTEAEAVIESEEE